MIAVDHTILTVMNLCIFCATKFIVGLSNKHGKAVNICGWGFVIIFLETIFTLASPLATIIRFSLVLRIARCPKLMKHVLNTVFPLDSVLDRISNYSSNGHQNVFEMQYACAHYCSTPCKAFQDNITIVYNYNMGIQRFSKSSTYLP